MIELDDLAEGALVAVWIHGSAARLRSDERAKLLANGWMVIAEADSDRAQLTAEGVDALYRIQWALALRVTDEQHAEAVTVNRFLPPVKVQREALYGLDENSRYVLDIVTVNHSDHDQRCDYAAFDTLREVANWLTSECLQAPTDHNEPHSLRTWLSFVDYTLWAYGPQDHEAVTFDERTARPARGFTDRTWNAVIRAVKCSDQ